MVDPSGWDKMISENPDHSSWYIARFREMAADGTDLAGEARFIDALVERGARILDAGCGPGRVGAFLADAGHAVVGVDGDAALIAAAEDDHPGPTWLVGDLAELDLPARGISAPFDAIVCAGNVMPFLAPSTRQQVLVRFRRHLAPTGRVAVGFGSGRGYDFDEFRNDVRSAGLRVVLELASWDIRPMTAEAEFIVALLARAAVAENGSSR